MSNQIDPIGWRDAKIAELEAAIREFACTGTDDPCGCYRLLSQEKTEIKRLRAALKPFAAIPLWRDTYPDGPEIFPGSSSHLLGTFTPQQVRAARDALGPESPPSAHGQ